jgi:hypothetical protein
LYVSGKAIQDTVRGIIRTTEKAKDEMFERDSQESKLLSKAVRFYLQHQQDWGRAIYNDPILNESPEQYRFNVNLFWLAVQIDRAYQTSRQSGDNLLDEYTQYGWLPDFRTNDELIDWITTNLFDFGFQYTPTHKEKMASIIKEEGIAKALGHLDGIEGPYDKYEEEKGWVKEKPSRKNSR